MKYGFEYDIDTWIYCDSLQHLAQVLVRWKIIDSPYSFRLDNDTFVIIGNVTAKNITYEESMVLQASIIKFLKAEGIEYD